MQVHLRLCCVLVSLALAACSQDGEPAEGKADAQKKAEPDPAAEGAEPGNEEGTEKRDLPAEGGDTEPDVPTLADVGDEPIGVEACDTFVSAWKTCLEKAPADARGSAEQELAEQIVTWRQTAGGGEDAVPALEIGCKTARGRAKKTSSSWGCSWE